MRGLLVRVGADQSEGGGSWNGPVDVTSGEFAYAAIPEDYPIHANLDRPFNLLAPMLQRLNVALPQWLAPKRMHLDPDFVYLTYGDQGQRAVQISLKLARGDLLVFYAGLADIRRNRRLVYAIIGIYVIDDLILASKVPKSRRDENAHTRRILPTGSLDIVVRAQPDISGRLASCLHIGSYRSSTFKPNGRPCYRVDPAILTAWGGLSNSDGYIQRSARLPEFLDAARFYSWFQGQGVALVSRNN
jgi:hypothetical protein